MRSSKKQKELMLAIRRSLGGRVMQLLEEELVNPNFHTETGMTPLHEAVNLGNLGIVTRLVEAGADVNGLAKDGTQPLDWARKKNPSVIRYLKSKGAATTLPPLQNPAGKKPAAPPRQVESPFKAETLADYFNAEKWTGRVEEMQREWEKVPKTLKKKFDFSSALTEAQQETLKSRRRKATVLKKNPPINPL